MIFAGYVMLSRPANQGRDIPFHIHAHGFNHRTYGDRQNALLALSEAKAMPANKFVDLMLGVVLVDERGADAVVNHQFAMEQGEFMLDKFNREAAMIQGKVREQTRNALYDYYFDGYATCYLQDMSYEQLLLIPGIGAKSAEAIWKVLHGTQ